MFNNEFWFNPGATTANTGRAISFGGYDDVDVIDYFDTASAGNATDYGNLTDVGSSGEANSNDTVALYCFGRRNSSAISNVIEKVNVASTGNATDYGDSTESSENTTGGCSNSTISLTSGGYGGSATDRIDKK